MKMFLSTILLVLVFQHTHAQPIWKLDSLPKRWDEGIPLGNGMLGALIWQKDDAVRMSLDRADLWDERPMKGLHRPEFNYEWVREQVMKKDYKVVQENFDAPYDNEPGPTKIPGAALEFRLQNAGKTTQVVLDLERATAFIQWENGAAMMAFVSADANLGWFAFDNLKEMPDIRLVPPSYQALVKNIADPVGGDDLGRLGYEQGRLDSAAGFIHFTQKGWGNLQYDVSVRFMKAGPKKLIGQWTITRIPEWFAGSGVTVSATSQLNEKQADEAWVSHKNWWNKFWSASDIKLPDQILLHQWYMEQYKFGSAARRNAPPISLQAVWTADNGRIPPWKGDFHHDLNTQLSYWPAYSANHLEEAMGYLDHFERNKDNYRRYTKLFFGKDGIAVPGVTTLDGTEMGGWIQYSLSPTVSAWISQHYYMQWRYSMDRDFLREKAWPWVLSTATFLEGMTVKNAEGSRVLPMSSSPEIHDNDLSAWFLKTTNYDLALLKYDFQIAEKMAKEIGLTGEAEHWHQVASELPAFALSEKNELLVAPGEPYAASHRHFSNLMAIHPLGLYQWDRSDADRTVMRNSIALLDKIGPDWWCGYSYAWLGNLKARAHDGEGAVKALTTFSKAFCSTNSFHLNGDQTKSGLSKYQYRPFTLEGNFAFAAGLQEMLIQSYQGFIEVFPAVPAGWREASFRDLRTEGAFLVSATRHNGVLAEVTIHSEKGGLAIVKLSAEPKTATKDGIRVSLTVKEGRIAVPLKAGERLVLEF